MQELREYSLLHLKLKQQKTKTIPDTHVLQCDFFMAYSCEYQNEVALCSRNSKHLFTAALYSKEQSCKSFLLVTDSQDKGEHSVFTFIHKLSDHIEFQQNDS